MWKKFIKIIQAYKERRFFKRWKMLEKDETYGMTKLLPGKVYFTKKPIKTLAKLLLDFDKTFKYYFISRLQFAEDATRAMSNQASHGYMQGAWMAIHNISNKDWKEAKENYAQLHDTWKDEYSKNYIEDNTTVIREDQSPLPSDKDFIMYIRLRLLKEGLVD